MKTYIITCCKECQKREVGCHGTCPEYNRQKEEYNKAKEWQRINQPVNLTNSSFLGNSGGVKLSACNRSRYR